MSASHRARHSATACAWPAPTLRGRVMRSPPAVLLRPALGGADLRVLLRDAEVGAFLPAPGFPQTLSDARRWRQLADECLTSREAFVDGLRVASTDAARPVYAVASCDDVILALIGVTARPRGADELVRLLPLLGGVLRGERAIEHATARERVARQSAAHAERLPAGGGG